MKIRKDKDILSFIGVGLITILLGSVALFFQTGSKTIMVLGGISVLVGIIMSIMGLAASTKPKTELIADERITRINEKAGYAAFWIVLLAVTILYWADKIGSLNIELKGMYTTVLLVGAYSWLVLRWYYKRKVI
ncbi:MAG: DUF2178 domain-containing protein [Candidatus Aenigmarchaeota archaeon]|nr:DUF2178 domain-containing protein [Candidatus Aenigmarchaeota archaeon]